MASGESNVPAAVSASMPPPPMQFVNLYSDDNIRRGRAPLPPPPVQDSYSMFGVPFHVDDLIIRPLESQGIKRLYPQNCDRKKELKKLNYSILVNFLDLLDVLVKHPGTKIREEKIDDLNLLFIHVHHLINEFRPHQARETLRMMLEVQKRQRLETCERFQHHLDQVIKMLQQSLSSIPDTFEEDAQFFRDIHASTRSGEEQSEQQTSGVNARDKIMCDIVDNIS